MMGILTFLLDFFLGREFDLQSLLRESIIFGFVMSLINVVTHIIAVQQNGVEKIREEHLRVVSKRNFKSSLSKEEVIKILKEDSRTVNMKISEMDAGVLLDTKVSMKSFGEKIVIKLLGKKDSEFEYEISSAPKLKTTLVDFGKNLENVNQIENVLRKKTLA